MAESIEGMSGLQRRLTAIASREGQRAMMGALGAEVVRRAKVAVPRKTGYLGRSIEVTETADTSVTVTARAGYAAYVERGTKGGQVIVPIHGKALRWSPDAAGRRLSGSPRRGAPVVFARRVVRGATRAQPYLEPAAVSAARDSGVIPDTIIRRWNAAD